MKIKLNQLKKIIREELAGVIEDDPNVTLYDGSEGTGDLKSILEDEPREEDEAEIADEAGAASMLEEIAGELRAKEDCKEIADRLDAVIDWLTKDIVSNTVPQAREGW